jgi:hypothetical protein
MHQETNDAQARSRRRRCCRRSKTSHKRFARTSSLDGFDVSKENPDFGFDLTDGVRDVPEAFMCRVLDQMYDDMAGGGSYKYRMRHIKMTWRNVPVEETRVADELACIRLESRTDAERAQGSQNATLIELRPKDEENGSISLQSEAPWEESLNHGNLSALEYAWMMAI